jgi:phosphatidylglycerol:prolipoprotein diacylglycerol transferase
VYPRLFEVPEIVGIGPLTIYTYGVMLAAAYLLGLQLAISRGRRAGLDGGRLLDLGVYIVIAALVGAKLLLFLININYFRNNPEEVLVLARSGGVFYGGLIMATLVAFWYIRRHKLPFWTTCDVFAPGIALGHVIGRLGCLMAGCCFGKPSSAPWAITFTDPFAAMNVGTPLNVPLHPTQLYEAGAEFVILLLLLATERKGRPFAGRTFWGYMLLYAMSRFAIEFYRGDQRGFVMGMSTSQFISIVLAPLSVAMLVFLGRRTPAPEPAKAARRAA